MLNRNTNKSITIALKFTETSKSIFFFCESNWNILKLYDFTVYIDFYIPTQPCDPSKEQVGLNICRFRVPHQGIKSMFSARGLGASNLCSPSLGFLIF